jgi:hypothetical protein
LTTNKTPKTEEKKPKEKTSKSKSEKRKSKAAINDEEMADVGEAEAEVKPVDPVQASKDREKEGRKTRQKWTTVADILQFFSFDTNYRKASSLGIKRLRKRKCLKCRIISRSLRPTMISKLPSSAGPKSTKFSRH